MLQQEIPEDCEVVKFIVNGNKHINRVHYFAGVYIAILAGTARGGRVGKDALLDAVEGRYPTLRQKNYRYMLDDEVLIILDDEDVNLKALKDEHYNLFPDFDFITVIGIGTLKDIAIEKMKDYKPDLTDGNVEVRIGGTDVDVDYSHFEVHYSKKYNLHSVMIQGGVLIDFMPVKH